MIKISTGLLNRFEISHHQAEGKFQVMDDALGFAGIEDDRKAIDRLAQYGYYSYCAAMGFTEPSGRPMRDWEFLSPEERLAHRIAVCEVIFALGLTYDGCQARIDAQSLLRPSAPTKLFTPKGLYDEWHPPVAKGTNCGSTD
jgi:hypothetical protein